ncbi:MAG: hypothetical protein KDC95_18370 [Planctomycetes bacterium]|nr:hypothetical protein [Planctomycetota bacterium]
MRHIAILAFGAFFAADGRAQNEILYHGPKSYTSRGHLGTGDGELLQGFHAEQWRALGEQDRSGKVGRIDALRAYSIQDQAQATQESFRWVLRSGDAAAGPTTGASGELFVSGDNVLGPGVGTGPIAWSVTTTLTTPILVPSEAFFALGVRLPAAPNWSNDGSSVWATSQPTDGSSDKQVDMAWQIVGSASRATHPSEKRTWRLGFHQAAPALQLGHFSALRALSYAQGGQFPIAGTDGLALRVLAAGRDGQVGAVFVAAKFTTVFPVPGVGTWALDIPTFVSLPLVTGTVTNGKLEQLPLLTIPATLRGEFAFQGVLFDLGKLSATLTNAALLTL